MPLLRKKPFEKLPLPENIRDHEEVFYCSTTNEIFREYEQFSERMFLCNSMVWTCSFTGKSGLTYAEALQSEENARNCLKEFPPELKTPILYLATKTNRTSFSDMVDDIFQFAKDRYFIGENVETSFTGTKWTDSHILQVISPGKEITENKNGQNGENPVSSTYYKYEIEHLDSEDQDISEIMIVDFNHIRRKRGGFSRDKCKLFLKQYVEQDERSVLIVKSNTVEAFNLKKITFDQLFHGPPPEFLSSKKIERSLNGKPVRQESLHKFLTKTVDNSKNLNNINLLEKLKEKEDLLKLRKEQKRQEKIELKQKQKEEENILSNQLKNWYNCKEDLELEDQQPLPEGNPVKLKIPDEHLGDMFMIMEFVKNFSKLVLTKDYFPDGLTVELMERALISSEVAGPFADLIQMLLLAIFNSQDTEATQYRIEAEYLKSTKLDEILDNMNLHKASRLATLAAKWPVKYQGLSLSRLPLYSVTTSEILRLHLLASGAIINSVGAKWRYAQRGGYTNVDDPGLYLKLHSPEILAALKTQNMVELPIADKLKILTCLVEQLLTYAEVRDIAEARIETVRQAKMDLKATMNAERKREQEFSTAMRKLKRNNDKDKQVEDELNELERDAERKKLDNEIKIVECRKACVENQIVLGQDRAFRQYLILESVPGVFINFEEKNSGTCLDETIKQFPHLINANRDEILAFIKDQTKESNSSDKENSPSNNCGNNNVCAVNGITHTKNTDLLVCSADPETCIVHSCNEKVRWSFYHDKSSVNKLIESLNNRGVREHELLQNIKSNKEEIENIISKTPVRTLNATIQDNESISESDKRVGKSKYEDANLGYPNDTSPSDALHNGLIESLLEMEEKIYCGNLGMLPVKDRVDWRNCLRDKSYKNLDKTLTKLDNGHCDDSDNSENNDNKDFLKRETISPVDIGGDFASNQSQDNLDVIHSLAIALVQIGRSVEKKFLRKPLGKMNRLRNEKRKENLLECWEQSLLASTNFSQIFLHYSTLDACVMWSRSVQQIRCWICRRKNHSSHMLLCDSCNMGYHIYCLKPKLKRVPEGDWFCRRCQKERKPEPPPEEIPPVRPIFRDEEIEESYDESILEKASDDEKINYTDDDTLDDHNEISTDVQLCKMCGSGGEVIVCDKCTTFYHIECVEPPLRRPPRGLWHCMRCKNSDKRERSDSRSSDEEIINKRSSRRNDNRSDLPLHNSALHAVLSEVMKDYNAWPFLRPVQKNEVPDYYDVISQPMDFGTIKYKLNMGEYRKDAHFMKDALLVFQNCNTYNQTEDDVYKCGVQLLKHFQQKCREVGLKLPEELDYNSRPKKKIRTK